MKLTPMPHCYQFDAINNKGQVKPLARMNFPKKLKDNELFAIRLMLSNSHKVPMMQLDYIYERVNVK